MDALYVKDVPNPVIISVDHQHKCHGLCHYLYKRVSYYTLKILIRI